MTDSVTVGTATAARGTMVRGAIPVTRLAGGGALEIPLILIHGASPGPCLWIDAAIHGDEPEGTLTCQELARTISPDQLAGTLVLVPAMNVPAYEAAQRGNPLDTFSYDMNRIYPGRVDGYLTERIAHAHAQWLTAVADMEIAIHSGGAHSYLSEAIFIHEDLLSDELARAMGRGWEIVLSAISPKGTPMAVMLEAGKPGITVELGGRSATGPAEMQRVVATLVEAMRNVLRHYGMIPGEAHTPSVRWRGVQEALLAPASGLFLPAAGVGCQQPMRKGEPIACVVNLWGDTVAELAAPADGQIFGLRALANVTTGDWCCFYAKLSGTRD